MPDFKTDFHEVARTLRCRGKDKHAPFFKDQSHEVNFVWNFCNDLSFKVTRREGTFCSAAFLDKHTAGATKEGLSLHSQTIQAISKELVTRRQPMILPDGLEFGIDKDRGILIGYDREKDVHHFLSKMSY